MSSYFQVVRRNSEDGHQTIKDHSTKSSAQQHAQELNFDYQTDEYLVITRTSEGFGKSLAEAIHKIKTDSHFRKTLGL